MRWLAGAFDPHARADRSRLAAALAPDAACIYEHGALRISYSGAPAPSSGPLCVLDGFLDNSDELAQELGIPRSEPPERLLGAAWRRWGLELPARLRGDFALLVWDGLRGEGMLARDQLGVRSLFTYADGGVVYFANEIRCLLALLPRRPSPDPVGLAHWVAGRGRPGAGTLYEGVRRLSPGALLMLGRDGAEERRYWAPRYREPLHCSGPELAEQVREAIATSVRRRLSPGGHTGVLMSGGLDSAAVAASAHALSPAGITAYSGVFPDHPEVDESGLIEQLGRSLALPVVTGEVSAGGLLAGALESQRAWQVPLVGWGDFWTLPLLREAAGAGVETMLDGEGGDELFAVRAHLVADRVRAGEPVRGLRLLRRLPGAAYGPSLGELSSAAGELALLAALPYALHEPLRRGLAARRSPAWLRAGAARDLCASDDPLAWKRLHGPRWWAYPAHALTRGVEELGVFESLRRSALLAGLQTRHPLLDVDLVELVLRAPPLSSFDARVNRPLLRASMAGLLPDAVRLRRRKALFDSLIADCLLGSDGAAVRALLASPDAELRAIVDLDGARHALLERGHEQPFSSTQQLWRLLTAECWLKAQVDPDNDPLPAGLDVSRARVRLRPPASPARALALTA